MIEVYLGHKIPATPPLAIGEQGLMLKVEVDKGLIPATNTIITKVNV